MINFCEICNENVNFSSKVQLVDHYRSKKHRNNLKLSGKEPGEEEKIVLNLTKKELEEIRNPRREEKEIVPLQLYAQYGDKKYKIVADRNVIGKVVGK
jgi:hypothetical protein